MLRMGRGCLQRYGRRQRRRRGWFVGRHTLSAGTARLAGGCAVCGVIVVPCIPVSKAPHMCHEISLHLISLVHMACKSISYRLQVRAFFFVVVCVT